MPLVSRLCKMAAVSLLMLAPAMADSPSTDVAKRGEYLARAGDCFGCHTQAGGVILAGGRQVQTPYGTISSPNITPDPETGIGKWSDDDFYKLFHDGINRDGQYIYPVMPFDHYTKVTRDDALAIKAYLFSLPPAHAPRPPGSLAFPFNVRTSLLAWRTLFFKAGQFQPDPARSAEENRGAYLVEGLGHCGACHTARNILSGSKTDQALGGGEITGQGWFAPNITSDVREGIGSWSDAQLVAYLKSGVAPGKAIVAGPMAETIHLSLQYMTDADLHAMAAYLKASPAKQVYREEHLAAVPGANAYLNNCAACHQPDGKGAAGVPPLAGNGVVKAGGADGLIRTILGGMPAHGEYAAMPGFATQLSTPDVATIATYVRSSWGNGVPPTVTAEMVDNLAGRTHSMLAGTGQCDPVQPPAVATAIAGQGIDPMLRQVNAANMQEQIGLILPKLKSADGGAGQADVVNGLTAAYCPIVMADAALQPPARLQLLQQFMGLVYSQIVAPDMPVQAAQSVVKQTAAPTQR